MSMYCPATPWTRDGDEGDYGLGARYAVIGFYGPRYALGQMADTEAEAKWIAWSMAEVGIYGAVVDTRPEMPVRT